MMDGATLKDRERDIFWFKNIHRHLTTEQDWTEEEIRKECGLTYMTIRRVLDATKATIPKFRASTWAKVQDFDNKFKDDIEVSSVDQFIESNGNVKAEIGVKPDPIVEHIDPPVEIKKELDAFDLLRELSKKKEVNLDIVVTMNNV